MSRQKRIVVISEFFPSSADGDARGGVEVRCWQLARRLAKSYAVTVLTSYEAGLAREETLAGISVRRCGPTRRYTQQGSLIKRFAFMVSVFFVGRRLQPDIVDAQSIIGYVPAYYIARWCDARSLITCHDVWLGQWVRLFGPMGLIGELYERFYLRLKWGGFIANSQVTKRKLIAVGVSADRITVVPNGVEPDAAITPREKKYSTPTVCTISRLVKYKRVGDLIEAVSILRDEGTMVECIIIGTGPEQSALQAMIGRFGLQRQVRIEGFVTRETLLNVLRRSHIFCLPSSVEGFGIVAVEAMGCGTPVIAADIPPLREVTEEGRRGLLYPVGNSHALAGMIRRYLADGALYTRQQVESFQYVRSTYHWEALTERIKTVYQQL